MSNPNNLLLLSDCLAKIRTLTNEAEVNNLIQDKKFLDLARRSAEISRHANTCAGIFFDMNMANRPTEKVIEESSDEPTSISKTS